MSETPRIRWGIVAVGMISSWFVEDLMLERGNAPVKHIIQSIGGRDLGRCKEFAQTYCPKAAPELHDSYEGVYNDPEVDIVYIGTPHTFHKQNMLDAIAAGKNILCEKAFTITSNEAREVFDAAKAKGVYVMEAMWLRFRPLVHQLRKLLFEDKVIGDVYRTFADFALEVDIKSLPATSRYKDRKFGAGTLLDTGIYSLTWAILTLDAGSPGDSEKPLALGVQSQEDGIEVNTSILLQYQSTGRQGIVSSTTKSNGNPDVFCTVYGTDGTLEVEGPTPSLPLSFTVYPKMSGDPNFGNLKRPEGKKYDFPKVGRGFIYEADSTALAVLDGKLENAIMPWSETIQVMEIMDSIRKQNNYFYPGHDEP